MPVANDPNTEWERLAESIGFMIEEVALSIHETDLATIFSLLTKFQIEKLNLDIDKFSEIGTWVETNFFKTITITLFQKCVARNSQTSQTRVACTSHDRNSNSAIFGWAIMIHWKYKAQKYRSWISSRVVNACSLLAHSRIFCDQCPMGASYYRNVLKKARHTVHEPLAGPDPLSWGRWPSYCGQFHRYSYIY